MTPELTIMGLLVGAIGTVFALYQRGVTDQIKSIRESCAAKDAEILWLRKTNESWTGIAQEQVRVNEQLADAKGKP